MADSQRQLAPKGGRPAPRDDERPGQAEPKKERAEQPSRDEFVVWVPELLVQVREVTPEAAAAAVRFST